MAYRRGYDTRSYDQRLEKISTINKLGRNIEAEKSEMEAEIDIKFDKITGDNTKLFNSFDMKMPALTANRTSSSYEQHSSVLIKCPLLKYHENIHMHPNSPNICLP